MKELIIKDFIKNNRFFIMVLLYIGLILLILIKIYDLNNFDFINKENFDSNHIIRNSAKYNKKTKKIKFFIRSSIINYIGDGTYTSQEATKKYFGVFYPKEKDYKNKFLPNELYSTTDIGGEWNIIRDSQIDNNKIISDLTYDREKNLIAVSLHIDKGNPIYNIYSTPITKLDNMSKAASNGNSTKQTSFTSIWKILGEDIGMRSLFYDNVENYWLGVSAYDGQIYHNKNNDFNTWEGPIDIPNKNKVPLRKIMYGDEIMMGIGLIDNHIYKKNIKKWRESEWETDKNDQKVFDIMFDTDSKMIVSTHDGLKKQISSNFDSKFGNYIVSTSNNIEAKTVLFYRTGIYYIEDYFNNNTLLGKKLKKLYDFKKITKKLCGARNLYLSNNIVSENQILPDDINKQNNEISDLYNTIGNLFDKLNK